jgi:hypothetical protein
LSFWFAFDQYFFLAALLHERGVAVSSFTARDDMVTFTSNLLPACVTLMQVKFIDFCDLHIKNRGQGKGAAGRGHDSVSDTLGDAEQEDDLLLSC